MKITSNFFMWNCGILNWNISWQYVVLIWTLTFPQVWSKASWCKYGYLWYDIQSRKHRGVGYYITYYIFRRVFIKLHHSFIYCLFPQNEMPALYRFYFPHFLLRTEIRPAQSSVIHHLYFFLIIQQNFNWFLKTLTCILLLNIMCICGISLYRSFHLLSLQSCFVLELANKVMKYWNLLNIWGKLKFNESIN